jgi:uncharacterized protein
MEKEVIKKTLKYVKEKFEGEGSGHDWWHIHRVWRNAITIGIKESANLYVVQLGALLHDIADFKFHDGDSCIGGKVAREHLENLRVDEKIISEVCYIVDNVSFKGKKQEKQVNSLECKVVRDADRLDAIGAIGIARCFAYGGHVGAPIYDPESKPKEFDSVKDYVKSKSGQINHFC